MFRSIRSARGDAGLARSAVLLGVVGAVVVGATAAVLLTGSSSTIGQIAGVTPTPAPTVDVALAGASGSTVPWSSPLTFSVTHGTLTSLVATAGDGSVLPGRLTPTSWVSATTLVPGQTYTLHADVKDGDGHASTIDRTVTASAAARVLHATVAPDGGVYGIGQPVIIRFDHGVRSAAARAAVLTRLAVTTAPAVQGAWHWFNSYEVHYRGRAFWAAGTTVDIRASLAGLHVPGTDIWGSSHPATGHFSIARAFIATVDITKHIMTVTIDGKLVRTVKVSTGRDKYPTKGGIHIVLTREKSHLYDSATVGIPTASPDGYYENLPYSDRISNAGAFVHANPATTRVQGIANVSHGCVNTSVADAKWFYENSHLGDVVNIIHAVVGPVTSDEGMADWNYTWAQWQSGNLNG